MKKIQLVFAVLAFFSASLGVYATEYAFATIYYEDTAAPGTCNVIITLPCNEGANTPCRTAAGNNVWKSVNGGTCVQLFKP